MFDETPMEIDASNSPEIGDDDDDDIQNSPSSTSSSSKEILNLKKKCYRMKNVTINNKFVEIQNAFKGILKTYFLKNTDEDFKDICLLLTVNTSEIKDLINHLLYEYGALKFNILVECTYVKPLSGESQSRAFKTKNITVFKGSSLNSILKNEIDNICAEECEYQSKGSGWTLHCVDGILLRCSKYRPLRGSSYLPLPNSLKNKYACVNPQNFFDNKCFMWALLARYVTGNNCHIVDDRYKRLCNRFNFNEITFPVSLKSITKFEKTNVNLSVNVYGLDSTNTIYPLRICYEEKENHFDLIMLTNEKGVSHYVYIKNFNRLIVSQLTTHTERISVCKRCFKYYKGPEQHVNLMTHKIDCNPNKSVKAIMPQLKNNQEPSKLKFVNHHHKFKVPIVAYADFECILRKVNEEPSKYTTIENVHEPFSFCSYLVVDKELPEKIVENLPTEPFVFRGDKAAEKFVEHIIAIANLIGDLISEFSNQDMLPLTIDEINQFQSATHCEMCNVQFTLINSPVRDHCHFTGKYRSALCNTCNLKRKNQTFLPVFIHNSSNYDSHFIIKQLGCDEQKIHVIPNTSEKFVSFTKCTASKLKIRFLDSFRFLSSSLEQLAKNLPKDKFYNTSLFFNEEDMIYVTRKGCYPYDYTNNWSKLEETKLPDKKYFRNSMTDEDITDDEYTFAQTVWNQFNCKTLGDYSDLYLKTDVLLLADVFENFRNICMINYEVDPAHYLTVPSLTFDAMLKYTKIELELISDYDMYMMIEKGIRGGIVSCVRRYAKANNKYISDYDDAKPSSYLAYIDANNLYGDAMSRSMPHNNFKWLSKNEIINFDILNVGDDDSDIGYILEVDVAYPTFLHDKHSDFPFLPEKKCPEWAKQQKLLLTLDNKERYVCHYMILKQAVLNGLVLKKIHRVIQFNQSCWLRPYISFNTEKRKLAENDFEKDFYKLLNNAMFGKTIENVRNRMNLELVNNEKRLNKLISKPSFLNRIIYNENLCAIECAKDSVFFNKPIYIGFTVLELSKHHMYDFYYRILKPFYDESSIRILYLDTDSFFLKVKTEDLYDDFNNVKLKQFFDMSDYSKDHKCYFSENKKKLGCFKDETCGVVIQEFIGLRSKLYTYKTVDDHYLENVKKMSLRKAKGVTKNVIKKYITFNDYKLCLDRTKKIRRNMKMFRSKKHELLTISVNKIALSGNDDKRIICNNGVHTYPYGHYRLKNTNFKFVDNEICLDFQE